MAIADGGPAFPRPSVPPKEQVYGRTPGDSGSNGMSLRDWFAGQIVGALFNSGIIVGPETPNDNERLARCAYAVADAMLAERTKRGA